MRTRQLTTAIGGRMYANVYDISSIVNTKFMAALTCWSYY